MSLILADKFFDGAVRRKRPAKIYQHGGKRVFDLILVALIVPIALPIIGLAWLAMRIDGAVGFYAQPRVGRDGRIFSCWKIRTMTRGADAELAAILARDPQAALEWDSCQKLTNDPRITRLGQILRCTSIDELPQLWNVVTGEMSLIGPRPFTPDQKPLYDRLENSRHYYQMRPGLSGPWQVSTRNAGNFCDRVVYDANYAVQMSLMTDMFVFWKTILVVLKATGK